MMIKEVVCAQANGTHAYMITQIKGYLQNVLIMNIGFGQFFLYWQNFTKKPIENQI